MKTRTRKLKKMLSIASTCLALSACSLTQAADVIDKTSASAAVTKTQLTKGAVTSSDQLPFPLGNRVEAARFTGIVYIDNMINNADKNKFPQTNNIIFEPGSRSSWHSHGGMMILGTGGVGYYQEEGKPAQIIRKGDVVRCDPGVRHWHGATPDSWFSQMVIYDSHYVPEGEQRPSEPVTDEVYYNLQAEECTGRTVTEDNDFMFQRAAEPFTTPNFNGTVYVSDVFGNDNAAGSPGLHYVVFGEGVINSWHIHKAGQILIATDGVGYHQIEGQPVQVMHPGDVAICPPGVKHWHGGSADTEFAHLAANLDKNVTGVEWFDRITEAEYNKLSHE